MRSPSSGAARTWTWTCCVPPTLAWSGPGPGPGPRPDLASTWTWTWTHRPAPGVPDRPNRFSGQHPLSCCYQLKLLACSESVGEMPPGLCTGGYLSTPRRLRLARDPERWQVRRMHTQQPPAIHTQQPPATPAQHTAARHPQQPLPSHAQQPPATDTQQPPATDTQQPAATDAQQPPATDAQQVPATPSQQTPGMRSQGPGLQTPESTGKQSQLGSPSPRLRRDLLATGVTDAEIRAAVRRGRTTRLGSGLYVDTHLYRTLNPDEPTASGSGLKRPRRSNWWSATNPRPLYTSFLW